MLLTQGEQRQRQRGQQRLARVNSRVGRSWQVRLQGSHSWSCKRELPFISNRLKLFATKPFQQVFLPQVGKTAIISQFLYDNFSSDYKGTVDEMYHGEFTVSVLHRCWS